MASPAVRRSGLGIAAAVLALLCGSSPAHADFVLMVSAISGAPTPNPTVPQGPVTCFLSATVYDAPPTPSYPGQIQGPFWSWGAASVQYTPTMGGQPQPAPPGQANVLIDQPDGGSPDATLSATFNQVGFYTITVTVTCSYTDLPATDVWTGMASATLSVTVYAPSPTPTLTLVASQYAVCAGGQNDSLHQAILTATCTDGQGNPTPNVLVDFSTTDGGLSALSATTDGNGQAPITLTSSQNASDSGGQYFATVTAALDAQSGVYATAQVEFQPPTLSLTAAPGAIAAGAASQLSLTLTWNGLPVAGHAIGWRIARIWDVNQQLIYNDTGNPPSDYITLAGPQSSASPSNQQGQASQSAQAGSTPGRVEIGATDQSVLGASTQANPGTVVQMAAAEKVLLKSLEFTSDDAKLCDGKDIITAGKRYTKPEWHAGTNNPITHTAGDSTNIAIKLTLTVAAGAFPANSACTLTGICEGENALAFTGTGTLSDGDNTIALTATNPIGKKIRTINASITWSVTVVAANQSFPLGDTGLHTIYTTVGTPDDSGPDDSTVPNPSRMDIVVAQVSAAITAAATKNYKNINAGLVWQLNPTGEYYLGRQLRGHPIKSHKGAVECWYLTQVSTAAGATAYDTNATTGADCISIATWLKNVSMVAGLPGSFDSEPYIAYYVTTFAPKRPETSVIGSFRDKNGHAYLTPFAGNNTYGLGVSTVGGTHNDWYLALADRHCLKGGNAPPAPGTVGTGPSGVNSFEAAVVYIDPDGKYWFFPGGTSHCYSDINKIVQIFQTLAWFDDNLIVQAVDYTYAFPANGPPDDVP